MTNSKRFKVLAIMPKSDGQGEYFTRVGTAFENKDRSINCYLDLLPAGGKQVKLQIRELEEADLRPREGYRSRTADSRSAVANEPVGANEIPF